MLPIWPTYAFFKKKIGTLYLTNLKVGWNPVMPLEQLVKGLFFGIRMGQ